MDFIINKGVKEIHIIFILLCAIGYFILLTGTFLYNYNFNFNNFNS